MKVELPVVTCEGCGLCCSEQGTPPFSWQDGDRPPVELEWDIQEHAMRYDYGLPCLWWDCDTKLCRHYDHRPRACREAVVPGDEFCLGFRSEGGLS